MHMKSIRVFKRHNRRELPDICSVARPGTATLRRFMLPICTLRQLMVLKAALIVCLSVLLRAWGQRLNDSICFQDASFYGYCHNGDFSAEGGHATSMAHMSVTIQVNPES